jgi:hypothetical protein
VPLTRADYDGAEDDRQGSGSPEGSVVEEHPQDRDDFVVDEEPDETTFAQGRMAAAVLFVMPVIVLFFLAQRAFIEGVTLTGTKG